MIPVYCNKFYAIYPNDEGNGYLLINQLTGVNEGVIERLPSAVSQADVCNELLIEIEQRVIDEALNRQ